VVALDQSPVYHLYIVRFKNRNQVQQALKVAGIASDIYYPQPLHLCQPCLELPLPTGGLPVSELASQELLALPLYPELTREQVKQVVEIINIAMDQA